LWHTAQILLKESHSYEILKVTMIKKAKYFLIAKDAKKYFQDRTITNS